MAPKWLMLLFLISLSMLAGLASAKGPLPVIYPEDDDDDEIVESQQNYIDNQSYLQRSERQRRERALSTNNQSSVAVISSKRERYNRWGLPGYRNRQYDERNSFFGIDYQSGNTVIRYYDGYQVNCCAPQVYYVHPRQRPPRPVPHR